MSDQPRAPAAPAPRRQIRCPACGAPSLYAPANRYRPFCSERCKLRDLGAWSSEQFRLPEAEPSGSDTHPAS